MADEIQRQLWKTAAAANQLIKELKELVNLMTEAAGPSTWDERACADNSGDAYLGQETPAP